MSIMYSVHVHVGSLERGKKHWLTTNGPGTFSLGSKVTPLHVVTNMHSSTHV